ncbi:hypothetical protein [Pedobacter psychrodurus]|uniref:hypothetical protein n=1 Tax=Pedobacter psychrodurus TaxID=2530456 RepID=UPI0029307DE5|nr:hypothetical protein [Pedobacter psychrodurus]
MFTFYDTNDLLLLQKVSILSNIEVPILVCNAKLKRHNGQVIAQVRSLHDKGLVSIKETSDIGFEFVLEHRRTYRALGNSFLEMIHMCISHSTTIVVNDDETMVRSLAKLFKINVFTMEEFNQATVNNKEYFEFINEIKRERDRRINSRD